MCAILTRFVTIQFVTFSQIARLCDSCRAAIVRPRGRRMTVMHTYSNYKIWFTVFLLLIAAGCSDPDKTGSNPTVTPPTVVSVAPANGAAGACPNTTVTATFSQAMNPATINGTTFTLTGPGTTPVAGGVTYNPSSKIAIFTP